MRASDIPHYFRLRRLIHSPWQALRFRAGASPGERLELLFHDGRRLTLVAGTSDYHVFRELFLHDAYRLDPETRRLECVVDIGANIGMFAFRCAPRSERVICYEPYPANFSRLSDLFRYRPGVEVVQAAVAGRSGRLRLFVPDGPKHQDLPSLFPRVGDVSATTFTDVAAVTLDQLFENHSIDHCDLLKLDVEGAEYDILYGADEATLRRIERIVCEYHPVDAVTPDMNPDQLARFLELRGFGVERRPARGTEGLGLLFAERRRG